jgi:hypothetical protein
MKTFGKKAPLLAHKTREKWGTQGAPALLTAIECTVAGLRFWMWWVEENA